MPGDVAVPASVVAGVLRLRPDQLQYNLDGETLRWLENLPTAVEDGDKLFVVIHEDQPTPFYIMQTHDDGAISLLWRSDHLGEDTYTALRRMRNVPLSKRLDEFEKEEAKHLADQKQERADELYETLGGPMYRELHRNGFAHGRAESYRRAGPKVERARKGA
jgi:hypothetical protein